MISRTRPISSQFLALKATALFVLWIMLSASFTWVHLGLGLILSFTVAWLNSGHSPFVPNFRLWGNILLYLPWLFLKIVQSSLHLSKLILHPALPITLTPGTITAEVDHHSLIVHAMDEISAEEVTSGRLESKIAEVFRSEGQSS